jgi:hypothetical protein
VEREGPVTTALLGFGGVAVAAILAMFAALRTGRSPSHLADVQGMALLIDELQEERDVLRGQLRECQAEAARLRGEGRA